MTNANANKDDAQSQAAAQYESIVSMLAAVNCDFSRLDELVEELASLQSALTDADQAHADAVATGESGNDTWSERAEAMETLATFIADYQEELKTLQSEAGECENEDDAREAIQNDPLEVMVRSDWTTPGEDLTPSEFTILLCTGGPAVRIMGELNQQGEPDRAWLEYQDWGTPWTRYYGAESGVLVEYASHFIFQM